MSLIPRRTERLRGVQFEFKFPFETIVLERDNRLLDVVGLNAKPSNEPVHDYGFNEISENPEFCFCPIAEYQSRLCISVSPFIAHQRLLECCHQELNPLCIWGIDALLAVCPDVLFNLPERPNPERKIIIMTQGLFCTGKYTDYSSHICLKERDDGRFDPVVTSKHSDLMLYDDPKYDVVAMCIPASSCRRSVLSS